MSINPSIFICPEDRKTLKKLKAIPGFSMLFKAFMKVWSEQNFRVAMLSSKLKVSEKQLPQYHQMLCSLCEDLCIDVPELYIESNPYPNSYTIGEKKPMIVLTTGLLDCVPTELIPTVLAHECGHIICGHVLYTTIAHLVIKKGIISSLSSLLSAPLEMGFNHWMRASEYSADRVAAVIDGTSEKLTEVCMHYAGYGKGFPFKPDAAAFLAQAEEYEIELKKTKNNRTFEINNMKRKDHPLCVVRARTCHDWANTDAFTKICKYVKDERNGVVNNDLVPVPGNPSDFIGKKSETVGQQLQAAGFTHIAYNTVIVKELPGKDGQTVGVMIGTSREYQTGDLIDKNEKCLITYYRVDNQRKSADEFNGYIKVGSGSSHFTGMDKDDAVKELSELGFRTIITVAETDEKKKEKNEPGSVISVTISGLEKFRKNMWFDRESDVVIAFIDKEDSLV